MKIRIALLAGLVAVGSMWSSSAMGQAKPACNPQIAKGSSTPDRIAGQVVKIDHPTSRVTIKEADGQTYEFTADKETLQNLKVGDRLEATLRAPAC